MRVFPGTALALGLAAAAAAQGNYVYRGSTSGEIRSTTGDFGWGALAVEAKMRQLSGTGASGLILHYRDSASFYLFLNSFTSNALMIYKQDNGWTLLASQPALPASGSAHTMRAESDGRGNLALYWDGALAVTAFDATFSSGKVGVRAWQQIVDFDDVVVRAPGGAVLFADDFEDGDDDGWSGGASWSVVQTSGSGQLMPQPVIDSAFENGNVEVTGIDRANWTVFVRPQLEGTSPYRAWFHFKMSNLSAARPTSIAIQSSSWLSRPVYSYDRVTWTEFGSSAGGAVTFTGDPVWIAQSIPYTTQHTRQLMADLAGPSVTTSVLSTSEGGRPVHRLTITEPGAAGGRRSNIWVLGRQHAWEAPGSWIVDRLARWLASSDRHAQSLRQKAVVHLVPIVDVDNVVLGGSGKDQQPIDMNRDWRAAPHWNAVRDTIAAIDATAGGLPYDVFIDSHCPGSGTFLGVQPQSMVPAAYWSDVRRLRRLLIGTTAGAPRPYTGSTSEWGPSYHPLWNQMSFWHQYTAHPELRLSLTLETQSGTLAVYQGIAEGLGRALDLFLYRRFGAPTPHSQGTPRIDFTGTPTAGNRATALRGVDLLPGASVVFALGAPLAPPLPLAPLGGVPGSTLLIAPAASVPLVASAAGEAVLGLPLPRGPAVVGAQMSFQALQLDAGLGPFPLPLAHTDGLTVEIAP